MPEREHQGAIIRFVSATLLSRFCSRCNTRISSEKTLQLITFRKIPFKKKYMPIKLILLFSNPSILIYNLFYLIAFGSKLCKRVSPSIQVSEIGYELNFQICFCFYSRITGINKCNFCPYMHLKVQNNINCSHRLV